MPDEISPQSSDFIPELQPKNTSAFARIWKYIAVRLATLAIMVFVGIFISIVVINYGGQLDKIYEAAIIEAVPKMAVNYPNLTSEEKAKVLDQIQWDMEKSLGLHSSFIGRCLRWTAEAMVFNTQDPSGTGRWDGQDQQFLQDVLSRFPKTLLLVGTTNMLVFIASLFLGLYLSKQQGKFLDRLMSGLVPLSSIPNWAFAILLTAIFA
jgi:ABC-type dipeptide/oligopeptide/nickel transport system permease component